MTIRVNTGYKYMLSFIFLVEKKIFIIAEVNINCRYILNFIFWVKKNSYNQLDFKYILYFNLFNLILYKIKFILNLIYDFQYIFKINKVTKYD